MKLLVDKYTLKGSSDILNLIERKVIKLNDMGSSMIEVYPLYLSIYFNNTTTPFTSISTSRSCSIHQLLLNLTNLLNISNINTVKLFNFWRGNKNEELSESNKLNLTLFQLGIDSNQELLIETNTDINNNNNNKELIKENNKENNNKIIDNNYYKEGIRSKGGVGIINMGNTCFMNTAIQVIAHIKPIVNYLIDDKYKKDINKNNKLGTKGELIETFAYLIKQMNKDKYVAIGPRQFKIIVSQYASQFAGNAEHDSQEFISYLIDTLHEDVNLVLQKPYISLDNDIFNNENCNNELVINEMAIKYWNNHKSRNDSLFVDLFHGQFKSKIQCNDCNKIAITFDPFLFLPLPLPINLYLNISIYLVFNNYSNNSKIPIIKNINLTLMKTSTIGDLKKEISKYTNINIDCLILTEVINNKINKIYDNNEDKITTIKIIEDDNNKIVCYIINTDDYNNNNNKDIEMSKLIVVPVIFETIKPTNSKLRVTYQYKTVKTIALPLLLLLPRCVTVNEILDNVTDYLFQFVKTKSLLSIERFRELLFIKKGNNDDDINTTTTTTNNNTNEEQEIEEEREMITIKNKETIIVEWDITLYKRYYEEEGKERIIQYTNKKNKKEEEGITIKECLDLFTSEEQLTGTETWYCSNCKSHKNATKKMEIYKGPLYLLIHLKRFSTNGLFKQKLNTLVNFPLELDLSNYIVCPDSSQSYIYEFQSVIVSIY